MLLRGDEHRNSASGPLRCCQAISTAFDELMSGAACPGLERLIDGINIHQVQQYVP